MAKVAFRRLRRIRWGLLIVVDQRATLVIMLMNFAGRDRRLRMRDEMQPTS